ncbi:MAG: hypothetical protein ACW981_15315 [Candidatus Hodarchaeales archaeon]|jgi:hypothetical protein
MFYESESYGTKTNWLLILLEIITIFFIIALLISVISDYYTSFPLLWMLSRTKIRILVSELEITLYSILRTSSFWIIRSSESS